MNNPPNACPLCGRSARIDGIQDGLKIDCGACGHFAITGSMEAVLGGLDQRLKEKMGFWTRDQNNLGELPVLGTYTAEQVSVLPDKSVMERAERLLRFGIREQRDLGGHFSPISSAAIGVTHSRSV